MGDITINGKNVITQSGSAEPVIASNVTGGAGLDAGDAGTLTGVLPVGVTGGSGLTELGTVTAGNLANTAIVYPAGHVIGVSQSSLLTSAVFTSTTRWDWGDAASRADETASGVVDPLSITHTAKGTNSKFLVSLHLNQVMNTDMDGGYHVACNIYSSADTYANPIARGNQAGSNRARVSLMQWTAHHSNSFANYSMSGNFLHSESIAKDATISYRVMMGAYYITSESGGTIRLNQEYTDTDANYTGRSVSTLTVMEIAT